MMDGWVLLAGMRTYRSQNWSKFEGGVPVFNAQGKIAKGADYTPPELSDYI